MRRKKLGLLVLMVALWTGCRDSTGPPPEREEKGPDEPRRAFVIDTTSVATPSLPD
jgi:hypothetical protein